MLVQLVRYIATTTDTDTTAEVQDALNKRHVTYDLCHMSYVNFKQKSPRAEHLRPILLSNSGVTLGVGSI